ncbi:MAG: hypothetical protein R3C16_09535 [Hyphomonadaceae bacterium]
MAAQALRAQGVLRRGLLGLAAAALLTLGAIARADAQTDAPIQHYIMIDLQDGADLLALDRWYINHHAPETLARTERAQTRYVSYRTYRLADEEYQRFNAVRGRMTHIGFASLKAFRAGVTPAARARVAVTPLPPAVAAGFSTETVTMRAAPTRMFKDEPTPERATPYFRWIAFMRAPEGVEASVFDAWVNDQLAPSLAQAEQAKRVMLFARIDALPGARGDGAPYTHVLEVWYESRADWRAATAGLDNLAQAAPWGGAAFPNMPLRSAFIGERPDLDFMSEAPVAP